MSDLRLLVFSPYFPPHVGGLEGYARDLGEALLRSGGVQAITVFTPQLPPESAAREVREDGSLVVRYPAFELVPNFPVPKIWRPAFWRAWRATSAKAHDLFVSHTRFFLTSLMGLGFARLLSRPLLHVEHGSDYVQLGSRASSAAARLYDALPGRFLLRHADGVLAVSEAAAEFVRRLSHRAAPVVRRGIQIERLDATVADEGVLAWAAGRSVVAFVGRLIDGKGVADLVQAFAALDRADAALGIVGDGPRRKELELLAEQLGIGPRAKFLGYLKEADAWAVIRAADIVVNPSYTEGLPTSVVEAACLGKAVLATNVGGTCEIVTDGDSAILVEPRDVDGLGRELLRLLGDPELRERLGTRARSQAVGRFDWDVSARLFLERARELTAGAGEPPQVVVAEERSSTSVNTDS